jgi:hypothetical protein
MSIYLAALLASSALLPDIDRAALDQQAMAEAARPALLRKASRPATLPAVGRRFRLDNIDEQSAVCRAAGASGDPVGFLRAFGSGYFLSSGQVSALADSCAIYLSGQAGRARTRLVGMTR